MWKTPLLGLAALTLLAGCGTAPELPVSVPGSSPAGTPERAASAVVVPAEAVEPLAPPFDRSARSTSDPTSPWVVVNKRLPLTPADFEPELEIVDQHLVASVAAAALTDLLAAADRAGFVLHVASSYRSPAYQRGVYDGIVARDGQQLADRWSARPGHSEHQTGLAVDLDTPAHPECRISACFGDTDEGRWVRRNARAFGFLLRYTEADRRVTGYEAEPWHLRYVGRPLAAELDRTGVTTLEEFFDLPGGDYAD